MNNIANGMDAGTNTGEHPLARVRCICLWATRDPYLDAFTARRNPHGRSGARASSVASARDVHAAYQRNG